MRRRHPALFVLLVLSAAACARGPSEEQKQAIARGQHLAKPFAPPGRCFGKPSRCVGDSQCAPPFSLCQEGTCCSGQIDPATCECRCGAGRPCGPRELCCDVEKPDSEEGAERGGGLRCRPVRECFGEE